MTLLFLWSLVWLSPRTSAQSPQPRPPATVTASPAPAASPAPEPTAMPTVAPSPGGELTITRGAMDGTALEAYREARRPQAFRVNLPGVENEAARELAPSRLGGRHQPVSLRGQALSGKEQPATVSLAFDPARAGASVWVDPVDGGTVNGKPGGRSLTLGPDGTLAFTFQAPTDRRDTYQVVIRLDNVETVLPFVVPDPDALKVAAPAKDR